MAVHIVQAVASMRSDDVLCLGAAPLLVGNPPAVRDARTHTHPLFMCISTIYTICHRRKHVVVRRVSFRIPVASLRVPCKLVCPWTPLKLRADFVVVVDHNVLFKLNCLSSITPPAPDDQSPASAADTFAGTGEGAGAVPRFLHTIHCVSARQNAIGEPAALRLSAGAQQ